MTGPLVPAARRSDALTTPATALPGPVALRSREIAIRGFPRVTELRERFLELPEVAAVGFEQDLIRQRDGAVLVYRLSITVHSRPDPVNIDYELDTLALDRFSQLDLDAELARRFTLTLTQWMQKQLEATTTKRLTP